MDKQTILFMNMTESLKMCFQQVDFFQAHHIALYLRALLSENLIVYINNKFHLPLKFRISDASRFYNATDFPRPTLWLSMGSIDPEHRANPFPAIEVKQDIFLKTPVAEKNGNFISVLDIIKGFANSGGLAHPVESKRSSYDAISFLKNNVVEQSGFSSLEGGTSSLLGIGRVTFRALEPLRERITGQNR